MLHGYLIKRNEIPDYFTEENLSAFSLWQNYRIFGFPYGQGWAEQPARLFDIIKLLEYEARKREAIEREAQANKWRKKK